MAEVTRHQCLIYEGSPSKYLPAVSKLIRENLQANKRCMYLNSPSMVAGIRSYLAATGLNVANEVNKRSLFLSSDQAHLHAGRFDVKRMLTMLSDAVHEAAADGYAGLWATGDMTWEMGSEKNFEKLLEYECGLEQMFQTHPSLAGICQYHRDTLPDSALSVALSTHRTVHINETLARVNPFYCPDESHRAQWSGRLQEMLNHLNLPKNE